MKKMGFIISFILLAFNLNACNGDKDETRIEITESALVHTVDDMQEISGVKDSGTEVKKDKISLTVEVYNTVNKEQAQAIGDRFLQSLAANVEADKSVEGKEGKVLEQYEANIVIMDQDEKILTEGSKAKQENTIKWK